MNLLPPPNESARGCERPTPLNLIEPRPRMPDAPARRKPAWAARGVAYGKPLELKRGEVPADLLTRLRDSFTEAHLERLHRQGRGEE